jgi:uridylate kinase
MATSKKNKYKRVILKLSGEALMGKKKNGIDPKIIENIANEVKPVIDNKIQVGVVIGGGNFFRGGAILKEYGISRITGDHLGMIATILNALAIRDIFNRLKIPTKAMSALPISGIIERYDRNQADLYLKQGFVIVFAGGTGSPLVTTDTALCLRGIELNADLLLKATNVDGVYSKDPKKHRDARFYKHLTYDQAVAENLKVMDVGAFCLGRDNCMKLRVYNLHKKKALQRILQGLDEGTFVE